MISSSFLLPSFQYDPTRMWRLKAEQWIPGHRKVAISSSFAWIKAISTGRWEVLYQIVFRSAMAVDIIDQLQRPTERCNPSMEKMWGKSRIENPIVVRFFTVRR